MHIKYKLDGSINTTKLSGLRTSLAENMDQMINSVLNFTYSEETRPPKDKRNRDNKSQFVDPGNKGQTTIQANQSNIAELTTGVYYFCVPQKEHKIHTLHGDACFSH